MAHAATVESQAGSCVQYFGLRYRGTLQVPEYKCATSPQIWYDQEVFRMFQRLGLSEGASATGQ